jgi:hypothetical protein
MSRTCAGLLLLAVLFGACSSKAASTSTTSTVPTTTATSTTPASLKSSGDALALAACKDYDAAIDIGNANPNDTNAGRAQFYQAATEIDQAAAKNPKWATVKQQLDTVVADAKAPDITKITQYLADLGLADVACTPVTGTSHPVKLGH